MKDVNEVLSIDVVCMCSMHVGMLRFEVEVVH